MSLKIRDSEKIPHSKSSHSRHFFCNQIIEYSVFLVSMINTEERTLTASLCVAVADVT